MNLSNDLPVPTHRLLIRRCAVSTWIGAYAHERHQPTTLMFDIDIDVDARRAAATDRIGDTLCYAEIVEDLRRHLADQSHHLLERLSEVVAERILHRHAACRVRVVVVKIGILPGVDEVGVEIERFHPFKAAPLQSVAIDRPEQAPSS